MDVSCFEGTLAGGLTRQPKRMPFLRGPLKKTHPHWIWPRQPQRRGSGCSMHRIPRTGVTCQLGEEKRNLKLCSSDTPPFLAPETRLSCILCLWGRPDLGATSLRKRETGFLSFHLSQQKSPCPVLLAGALPESAARASEIPLCGKQTEAPAAACGERACRPAEGPDPKL